MAMWGHWRARCPSWVLQGQAMHARPATSSLDEKQWSMAMWGHRWARCPSWVLQGQAMQDQLQACYDPPTLCQATSWNNQERTNKVYNQELEGTRIPTKCTTRNLKAPGYQQRVQPGTWRYQDTNKVYNQEPEGTRIPTKCTTRKRYTKIPTSVQPRKECAKVPTKCTCCWYLGLLSCKSAYTAEKDLLFWQLCFSPELQLLTWFYGMILE